ncbi:response regulator [Candidatus Woesearchaeota archaeon]|nr:response regulator [Candidatus Woesearchaeota archaeon]
MKGEKRTILVAEDEPDIMRLYEVLLSTAGYNTLLANDGAAALELLGNGNDISLAVFDEWMPRRGDGMRLTRTIKTNPKYKQYKDLPIIIIGAGYNGSGRDEEESAIEAGANCYMKKPFEHKELLLKIKELLGEKPPERAERY